MVSGWFWFVAGTCPPIGRIFGIGYHGYKPSQKHHCIKAHLFLYLRFSRHTNEQQGCGNQHNHGLHLQYQLRKQKLARLNQLKRFIKAKKVHTEKTCNLWNVKRYNTSLVSKFETKKEMMKPPQPNIYLKLVFSPSRLQNAALASVSLFGSLDGATGMMCGIKYHSLNETTC